MMGKFALVVVALLVMVFPRTEAVGQIRAPTDHKTQKKSTSYIGKTKATGKPKPMGKTRAVGKPKAIVKAKTASAASRKATTAARINTKRPSRPVVGRISSGSRAATRQVVRHKRPIYRPATKVVSARYAPRLRPCADPRRARRYGCAAPRVFLPPAPVIDETAPRALSLVNVHTGEAVTVTFWRDGGFVQSALDRLNDVLRDNHNDSQVQMDPELFNVLWRVRQRLRSTSAYRVLSAYRSPETNAWLASFTRGVASDSLHMRGQAIDVFLPGRSAGQVRAAAVALGLGGVGYYPRSGFVHLDTGPQRFW